MASWQPRVYFKKDIYCLSAPLIPRCMPSSIRYSDAKWARRTKLCVTRYRLMALQFHVYVGIRRFLCIAGCMVGQDPKRLVSVVRNPPTTLLASFLHENPPHARLNCLRRKDETEAHVTVTYRRPQQGPRAWPRWQERPPGTPCTQPAAAAFSPSRRSLLQLIAGRWISGLDRVCAAGCTAARFFEHHYIEVLAVRSTPKVAVFYLYTLSNY